MVYFPALFKTKKKKSKHMYKEMKKETQNSMNCHRAQNNARQQITTCIRGDKRGHQATYMRTCVSTNDVLWDAQH